MLFNDGVVTEDDDEESEDGRTQAGPSMSEIGRELGVRD